MSPFSWARWANTVKQTYLASKVTTIFGSCPHAESVCSLTIARVYVPIVHNTHGATQMTAHAHFDRDTDLHYIIAMLVSFGPLVNTIPCITRAPLVSYTCLCLNCLTSIGPSMFPLLALMEGLPPTTRTWRSVTCERVARDTLGVRFKNETTHTFLYREQMLKAPSVTLMMTFHLAGIAEPSCTDTSRACVDSRQSRIDCAPVFTYLHPCLPGSCPRLQSIPHLMFVPAHILHVLAPAKALFVGAIMYSSTTYDR